MNSAEDHEQILTISRAVDQVAERYLGDEPDWDPLHVVLPLEWCDGFMWMYRLQEGDAMIEMYKHGITRRYLMLDQHNRAYRYTGDGHVQIPVALAVERVFAGIEEMGWTRETAYDEEFVAEKHRQFREAGWTEWGDSSPPDWSDPQRPAEAEFSSRRPHPKRLPFPAPRTLEER